METKTPPSEAVLRAFDRQCAAHDWTHEYSDDGSVYRRGRAEREALLAAAKQSPELQPIYDAWAAYIFHGAKHPALPGA